MAAAVTDVGLLDAFEGGSMEMARKAFETNTLGTIATTTRAAAVQTWSLGRYCQSDVKRDAAAAPHALVYTAGQAAVNAFTELHPLGLEQFGVGARLIVPGRAPQTSFGDNSRTHNGNDVSEAYADLAMKLFVELQH